MYKCINKRAIFLFSIMVYREIMTEKQSSNDSRIVESSVSLGIQYMILNIQSDGKANSKFIVLLLHVWVFWENQFHSAWNASKNDLIIHGLSTEHVCFQLLQLSWVTSINQSQPFKNQIQKINMFNDTESAHLKVFKDLLSTTDSGDPAILSDVLCLILWTTAFLFLNLKSAVVLV